MRISDWSSDVCSSDLAVEIAILELRFSLETGEFGFRGHNIHDPGGRIPAEQGALRSAKDFNPFQIEIFGLEQACSEHGGSIDMDCGRSIAGASDAQVRSEARRVGKEGDSTWRSQWN